MSVNLKSVIQKKANMYDHILKNIISRGANLAEEYSGSHNGLFHNIPYLNKVESGIANVTDKTLGFLGEDLATKETNLKDKLNLYNSKVKDFENTSGQIDHLKELADNLHGFKIEDNIKRQHLQKIRTENEGLKLTDLAIKDNEVNKTTSPNYYQDRLNELTDKKNEHLNSLSNLNNIDPLKDFYGNFTMEEYDKLAPKDWSLMDLARHDETVAKNPLLINDQFLNSKRHEYMNQLKDINENQIGFKDKGDDSIMKQLHGAYHDVYRHKNFSNNIGTLGTAGLVGGIGYAGYKGVTKGLEAIAKSKSKKIVEELASDNLIPMHKAEEVSNSIADQIANHIHENKLAYGIGAGSVLTLGALAGSHKEKNASIFDYLHNRKVNKLTRKLEVQDLKNKLNVASNFEHQKIMGQKELISTVDEAVNKLADKVLSRPNAGVEIIDKIAEHIKPIAPHLAVGAAAGLVAATANNIFNR